LNKLLNDLVLLPFQILWKIVLGISKLPGAKPIEILLFLVLLVIFYASMTNYEYRIGLGSGVLLGIYLLIRGGMKE
jgi:hypothetical protein